MRRILALALRVFDFVCGFLRGRRDFHCNVRADGANLTCLNFTDEWDFSGVKHRLDLRGFKFKGDKIS